MYPVHASRLLVQRESLWGRRLDGTACAVGIATHFVADPSQNNTTSSDQQMSGGSLPNRLAEYLSGDGDVTEHRGDRFP